MSGIWTDELNEQLQELVMDLMFDFDAVAAALREAAPPDVAGQITEVACREQYSYLDGLSAEAEPPEPPAKRQRKWNMRIG